MSGHDSGPVFEEQPSSLIYPEGLVEGKVTLSCQARASPAASYRWVTHTHTFLVWFVIFLSLTVQIILPLKF